MQDSTTTGEYWEFSFEDPKPPVKPNPNPHMSTGYLEGAGKWENFTDDKLYEAECLLRAFLEDKKNNDYKWNKQSKWRKYTCRMMFEILYGREWSPQESAITSRLSKLMGYYSTRILKSGTTIRGKNTKKKVYILSAKRLEKPPYSLKLRLEWLTEKNELPCWQNMKLPKDLKPGHARSPKTDANMQARRQKHYEAWKVTQNNANRKLKSERDEKWVWDAFQGKRVPESELSEPAREARQKTLREAEHR